jgi:hypothetical protein
MDDLAIVVFMVYVVGWAALVFSDHFRSERLRANDVVAGAHIQGIEVHISASTHHTR